MQICLHPMLEVHWRNQNSCSDCHMDYHLLIDSLRTFNSVSFAMIREDGVLLDASAGFLKLLPETQRNLGATNVARFLLLPSFEQLKQSAHYPIVGIFTVGSVSGHTTSLRGTFYRDAKQWILLGEVDIEELSNINAQLSGLNFELAETQRDLSKSLKELDRLKQDAVNESLADPLTGLGNRRSFDQSIMKEIARARRGGAALSLVMCDLDFFKQVNDTYGHDVGDEVLKSFAKLIASTIRSFDIATRFGGEEFTILMPGADMMQAMTIAERIRSALDRFNLDIPSKRITASFGVATLSSSDNPDSLLKKADLAMYRAKATGRNRVVGE